MWIRRFVLALVIILTARSAEAVAEISETCAVQTGCFNGDPPGYPVTIDGTAGGSYRLTSNLIVPDENTDGISVNSSSITIDLNGFEIVRSGCEAATTDCSPGSGTGSGVERALSLIRGVSVRNESITGMGAYGVILGDQADISGLRVRWNRIGDIDDGLSHVRANTAIENTGFGLRLSDPSRGDAIYRENLVYGNVARTGNKRGDNSCRGLAGAITNCP